MAEDERFSNGSITATLLGGFVGIATDPTTFLIPMASGLKYSGIAQNIFMNMGRSTGGIAMDAISRNMLIQADKAGGNLQDMATDSLRDFVYGSALVGAGAALGGGLRDAKIWEMRRVMNYTADGVKIDKVVNKEGIVTGVEASMMPGMPMNAQAVSAANLYINENMKMGGLYMNPISSQIFCYTIHCYETNPLDFVYPPRYPLWYISFAIRSFKSFFVVFQLRIVIDL